MRRKPLLLAAVAVAAMLSATVAGAVGEPKTRPAQPRIPIPPPLVPAAALGPVAQPPKPKPAGFTVEQVKSGAAVPLHSKPGGPIIARAPSRTQFGSPQTLTVAGRLGGWLAVINEDVRDGGVAWIKAHTPAVKPKRTDVALRVDLHRKQLQLVDGHRVEKRMEVGVGRPGSPTPTGRFSITDKLPGTRYGGSYGCCILALSGTQNRLPPGWRGGNRLAIHGTNDPGTIGRRSSAGCLHADARDLKLLMRKVALGTPVFIHR
jgi:lipoprotein-anchoring transpeptidase ErfK/SrfK